MNSRAKLIRKAVEFSEKLALAGELSHTFALSSSAVLLKRTIVGELRQRELAAHGSRPLLKLVVLNGEREHVGSALSGRPSPIEPERQPDPLPIHVAFRRRPGQAPVRL